MLRHLLGHASRYLVLAVKVIATQVLSQKKHIIQKCLKLPEIADFHLYVELQRIYRSYKANQRNTKGKRILDMLGFAKQLLELLLYNLNELTQTMSEWRGSRYTRTGNFRPYSASCPHRSKSVEKIVVALPRVFSTPTIGIKICQ